VWRSLTACLTSLFLAAPLPGADDPPIWPPNRSASAADRERWEAIPVPAKTPFDGDARKRVAYLRSYRDGYFWAKYDHLWCPTNPQKDNLHAIRGWIEGWQAGVKAGGTNDLPAKYAPFVVWRGLDGR
jgi:hypothetical protein